MKHIGPLLILVSLSAHGDILTDTSPFMRSAHPAYSPEALESSAGLVKPSYAPFSPADSDLGVQEILQETPVRAPIHFNVGLDLHYTDNAPASLFSTADSSFLFSTYLSVSWKPHIANGWFADIGFAQEFYEFTDSGALDFENSLPYIGVVKNLVDLDDTIFYARYEYQRITTGSMSDSTYFANRIRTGLQKTLFSTPRYQLSGGVSAAFDLGVGPDGLERNEYAVELNYSYAITDTLSASTSARSSMWDFDSGRNDMLHIIGVELSYNFHENASISTGLTFTKNDSDAPFGANDTEAWQGGLSIGMNYNF